MQPAADAHQTKVRTFSNALSCAPSTRQVLRAVCLASGLASTLGSTLASRNHASVYPDRDDRPTRAASDCDYAADPLNTTVPVA